jgi:hypothetical protein
MSWCSLQNTMKNRFSMPSLKLGSISLVENMMYYIMVCVSQQMMMIIIIVLEIPIGKDRHFLILVVEHLDPAHGTLMFHGSVVREPLLQMSGFMLFQCKTGLLNKMVKEGLSYIFWSYNPFASKLSTFLC